MSRQRRDDWARRRTQAAGAAAVAALVVTLAALVSCGAGDGGGDGRVEEGRRLGRADAPVTIVDYEDFQ